MITKDTMITVVNKYGGRVGYKVDDLGVRRTFYPNEKKEISFEELEKLSYAPGGATILKDFLEIQNQEALVKLFNSTPEIEYFYTKEDIKNLMTTGTLDQFLDCLDFAPQAIKETIKEMAVDLPLNDMAKREAIQEKLGFNVTKAIEIKDTKFDGGEEDTTNKISNTRRRVTPPAKKEATVATPSGRRYNPDKK